MSQKTAEQKVDEIIHAYYHEHHNLNTYRGALAALAGPKIEGFTEAKRRVIEAFDYRIERLTASVAVLKKSGERVNSAIDDMESRLCELESLRSFVKGMVTKV